MNTTAISILVLSVKLAADTAKHLFVESDGSLPTAGGTALGTTQRAASSDDQVGVLVLGKGIATAAVAIAVGDALMVTATGQVAKQTDTNTIVGRALTAATAADEEIEYLAIAN